MAYRPGASTRSPETDVFDLSKVDLDAFLRDIHTLRADIDAARSEEDIAHLRKMERWGRGLTALGFATAGICPNPVSAACIALGRTSRWMLMHHIGHRGYDRVPGVPRRYTSKVFARGRRRYLDWFDWMLPAAWVYEHNVLHHAFTNEDPDPDIVERNMERVDTASRSTPVRWAIFAFFATTWKATYYAPSTMKTWANRRHGTSLRPNRLKLPVLLTLKTCWGPYVLLNFGLLPLPFLLFGPWAYASALMNVMAAELLANLHSFCIIAPNHAGDDLYRFEGRPASRAEGYVRQIVSAANYRTGSDLVDFLQMWLNYQIEHHVYPDLTMRQYRLVQPKLKALCERHGIPYVQEDVFRRLGRLKDVFFGKTRAPILGNAA